MTFIAPPATHRVHRIFVDTISGKQYFRGVVRVHVTRSCANCIHNIADTELAAEIDSSCMNYEEAVDAIAERDRWCQYHQTRREQDAFVYRPNRPVLTLVSKD